MKSNFTSLKQLQLFTPVRNVKFNLLLLLLSFTVLTTHAGNSLTNGIGKGLPSPISSIFISVAGHNLLLSWQVDKESFNYYEVEKSVDGQHFNTIGLVLDALDNSNTCLFKENKSTLPEGKMTWYRIKGYEKNGTVIYSESSSYLENEPVKTVNANAVSPNPFTHSATIKYFTEQAGFAQIKLQNTTGETLLSKQSFLTKGENDIQMNGLDKLATGIYVAKLIINGTVMVNQKVVKQ